TPTRIAHQPSQVGRVFAETKIRPAHRDSAPVATQPLANDRFPRSKAYRATWGSMSPERKAAASQDAIWPETTLITPAPARNAERHGSGPSYRRRSRARPSENHSMAIRPTAV